MSVLTLDVGGANQMTVACQRGGHAAPRRVGQRLTSFGGRLTQNARAELMVVPVVLQYLTATEAATVRSLFALGAWVSCSGDVFNNGGATVSFSGTITDEIDDTQGWWTISLTLYEVAVTGYTPTTRTFYLTNVTSVDDPGDNSIMLGSSDAADDPFAAGTGSETLLDGVTIPTCGTFPNPSVTCATATSPSAERTWLSVGSPNGGWMSGTLTVTILSSGGTGDHWALQDAMCILTIVRAGVDVATWSTDYSAGNGGFAGGNITMSTANSVLFDVQIGDQLRVEIYGRAARHGGYNTTDLQSVVFGNGGGGAHYGRVAYVGDVLFQ